MTVYNGMHLNVLHNSYAVTTGARHHVFVFYWVVKTLEDKKIRTSPCCDIQKSSDSESGAVSVVSLLQVAVQI